MKKLPTDLQSFEIIRENDYLYVDKTRYIHRMLEQGRYYFVSRPRRFGKSLMVSTIRCLFQNRTELFKGLWIAEKGRWQWEEYPVIVFDFNTITHDTPENFQKALANALYKLDKSFQTRKIPMQKSLLRECFVELIHDFYEKTKMPVVILIDEYDKPIIDHLGKGRESMETAKANRDILKNFLGVLKGADVAPLTRFVFITGVSKFSRVSIFSDLNNLNDITMNRQYSQMFGYTQKEMDSCFKDRTSQLAEETGIAEADTAEKLKLWYDGYCFSKQQDRVYNPFSVLRAFSNLEFGNYWFETGTPSFLINMLREMNYFLPAIENIEALEHIFTVYDLENLRPEPLLFQTGYITIKDIEDEIYILGYPNLEVRNSFLRHLITSFTENLESTEKSRFARLSRFLSQEDYESFFETVNAVFAAIPYTLKTKRNEAWFHTLFYLMMSASGAGVRSEVLTSRGRIDMVAEFSGKIFIMEFKCNQSAKAGLKQIHEKGYAEKYKKSGKKLILMGINFSSKKRNVAEYEVGP